MYRRPVTRRGSLAAAVTSIIREYTEETFVTQSELSRRSGVVQPTISNVFRGKTVFSIDQLDKVCEGLGLSILAVIKEADDATRL